MAEASPKQHKKSRVFLVEDHPVFRDGLARLVEREPDLAVCGEADTAPQALSAIQILMQFKRAAHHAGAMSHDSQPQTLRGPAPI